MALILQAAPAASQPREPAVPIETPEQRRSRCGDDNGVDRCDAAQQARTRASFGVPEAQALHRQGATVRRVFTVDGYGRDLPVVSFERSPGRSPRVVVKVQRRLDSSGTGPRELVELSAPLSAADWTEVLRRTSLATRATGPEQPADGVARGDVLNICMHSWVATFEAVDQGADGGVRSRTSDACAADATVQAAMFLIETAFRALPECTSLDRARFRHEAQMLQACALLEGDRVAAAEAMNRFNSPWFASPNADSAPAVRALFSFESTNLTQHGEPTVSGYVAVADAWVRLLSGRGGANFSTRRYVGQSADRVRVEGEMWRTRDEATEVATAEMVWVRRYGNDFQVASVTIGPWTRVDRAERR